MQFYDFNFVEIDIEEVNSQINRSLMGKYESEGTWAAWKRNSYMKEYEEKINVINRSYILPIEGQIESIGKLSKLKTFWKRCIRKLTRWYIGNIAKQQQDFNAYVVRTINIEYQIIQELSRELERVSVENAKLKEIVEPKVEQEKLDKWYKDFEDYFRGSEEIIKKHNECYLKYFEGKKEILELGCGRGEMLQLLKENGITAKGVDLNREMVKLCREKGLEVECKDCVQALKEKENNSLDVIFSEQVVEHLKFEELFIMMETAFTKLKKGGMLIIETVNPLSLGVFCYGFYIDPTHSAPVHPAMLRFLAESFGFVVEPIQFLDYFDESYKFTLNPKMTEQEIEVLNKLNKQIYDAQDYYIVCKKEG